MAEGNYSATTASGVQYNLTYDPGVLGVGANYDLTITNPDLTTTTVNNIAPGNVATPVNGTSSLSILSVLGNTNYVVAPGATATVNITAALLGSSTVYVGGDATINSGISLLSGMTVIVDGGTATAAGGSVLGALSGLTVDIENGGSFTNGAALISALNGTTINFGAGGAPSSRTPVGRFSIFRRRPSIVSMPRRTRLNSRGWPDRWITTPSHRAAAPRRSAFSTAATIRSEMSALPVPVLRPALSSPAVRVR